MQNKKNKHYSKLHKLKEMTPEQYKQSLMLIEEDFKKKKTELMVEYAKSKRIYSVGDIIEKHGEIVQVTSFSAGVSISLPYPIYRGDVLKKDLTKRKDNATASIHGNEHSRLIKKSNV